MESRDVLIQNTDADAARVDHDDSGDSGSVDRLAQGDSPVTQPEVSVLATEACLPPVPAN